MMKLILISLIIIAMACASVKPHENAEIEKTNDALVAENIRLHLELQFWQNMTIRLKAIVEKQQKECDLEDQERDMASLN